MLRRRQLDHRDEELVYLPDDCQEAVEIDRLGDVRVRVQVIAAHYVLLRVGRGQHDDGDPLQIVVRLDVGEYLVSGLAWQVEVKQDQVRPRRARELALA